MFKLKQTVMFGKLEWYGIIAFLALSLMLLVFYMVEVIRLKNSLIEMQAEKGQLAEELQHLRKSALIHQSTLEEIMRYDLSGRWGEHCGYTIQEIGRKKISRILMETGQYDTLGDYLDDSLHTLTSTGIWSSDCKRYIYPFAENKRPESYRGVWMYEVETDQNIKLKEGASYVYRWLTDDVLVLSDGLLNIKTKQFILLQNK